MEGAAVENGIQARLASAERRLDQSEAARTRIWGEINSQGTQIALILAELKRVNEKLDDAKHERESQTDVAGDRRFQAMMVVLAAIAGPIVLGAGYLIAGAHP